MDVEVGSHCWTVGGLQYDTERKRIYKEEQEVFDYIEYSIVLHFDSPAAAKRCFDYYKHNESVRIDIHDKEKYTGLRHLENWMKTKRREGCRVIFEKEKVMGELASKLLNR